MHLWDEIKAKGCLGPRRVHFFEEVESTNSTAMQMAEKGVEPGTVVISRAQTRGRGRLGKSWQSPVGTGLYFSVILQPGIEAVHLSKITLAAGLAVCRALDQLAEVKTLIKWPNDVLLEGKKLAGILTESFFAMGGQPFVILGVGLNVSTPVQAFNEELQLKATSLEIATGRKFDHGVLFSKIIDEIDAQVLRLEKGLFPELLDEWNERDATMGKWLTWLTADQQIINGKSMGTDREGQLRIKDTSGNTHYVLSGDINIKHS